MIYPASPCFRCLDRSLELGAGRCLVARWLPTHLRSSPNRGEAACVAVAVRAVSKRFVWGALEHNRTQQVEEHLPPEQLGMHGLKSSFKHNES